MTNFVPQQVQGGGPAVEKTEDAIQGAEDLLFKMMKKKTSMSLAIPYRQLPRFL